MKTRTLVSVLIIIIILSISFEGYATGQGSIKRAFRKDFVGTWVNSEYSKWTESRRVAKRIVKSASLMMVYEAESGEWPFET